MIDHIVFSCGQNVVNYKKKRPAETGRFPVFTSEIQKPLRNYFFRASSTATATATVAPTMGLLPMPRKPIIST